MLKYIRSYGRVKSRKLSPHKTFLIKNLLKEYEFTQHIYSFEKNIFEIGFGFGDFLFEKAKLSQDCLFIGSEPHVNGIANILSKLENNPLKNIKLSNKDAREMLFFFPDEFLDEVYILFPDPWHKAKHFKRRLINIDFIDSILFAKLKIGGKLVIATDHKDYKTVILSVISKSKKFEWNANSRKDFEVFPQDFVETKYQKKAILEGRTPIYLELERI
jgi:tRNA (guanine-N7-)-methyltransferase